MSIQPINFTLTDSQGVGHAYSCSAHGACEGQHIMFKLLGAGLGAIAPVLTVMASRGKLSLDSDMSELLKGVDLSPATSAVQEFLMRPDIAPMIKSILRLTTRDGVSLYNDGDFGIAYQANYSELLQAIWKVIGYNGFLPLPGISLGGLTTPS